MKFEYKRKRYRLTKKQKENVAKHRDLCPKCGSQEISADEMTHNMGKTIQILMICLDCDKWWVEQFKFEKAIERSFSSWDQR